MPDLFVTPSGHLITRAREHKKPWGLQIAGIRWCGNDMGEPSRYTDDYPADRCQPLDQLRRVDCVGCRMHAARYPDVGVLVARGHGPLEPSWGV